MQRDDQMEGTRKWEEREDRREMGKVEILDEERGCDGMIRDPCRRVGK